MQARKREGTEALSGVDTLAAHLLTILGRSGELEGLVSSKNAISLGAVASTLQHHRQWQALAVLTLARGAPEDAITIWKVRWLSGSERGTSKLVCSKSAS